MLGVCYRYTKSLDDAEDILQDGFVKVFQNLHQFKHEGELGGWIRRIMVNTAINYLKKSRKYQYDLSFEDEQLHPVTRDNPELKIEAREIADQIRQLPTGYQTVFNMYAVEGYYSRGNRADARHQRKHFPFTIYASTKPVDHLD